MRWKRKLELFGSKSYRSGGSLGSAKIGHQNPGFSRRAMTERQTASRSIITSRMIAAPPPILKPNDFCTAN
jgi:hypothetical protein